MRFYALVGTLCLAVSSLSLAQQPLNNDAVQKMVKRGLGDDVIVSMIQSQPGRYDVSPDTMVALKNDGVSDKILAAMASKNSAPAAVPEPKPADPYEDMEIGVYHKVKDAWTIISSEPVNWKTGGS